MSEPTITSKNLPPEIPPPGQKPPIVHQQGTSVKPVNATPSPTQKDPNPKNTVDVTEEFALEEGPIIAKPLTNPDFTNLKLKNPNLVARWVNRSAAGGIRVQHMLAVGFVPIVPADCIGLPDTYKVDGHVIYGDLIAMKINRKDYEGALLYNQQQAALRVRKGARGEEALRGEGKATTEINEGTQPASNLRKKMVFYQPNPEEADKLVGGSSK